MDSTNPSSGQDYSPSLDENWYYCLRRASPSDRLRNGIFCSTLFPRVASNRLNDSIMLSGYAISFPLFITKLEVER